MLNEKIWVTISENETETYLITSKSVADRSLYYLYEVKDGKLMKLHKARDPTEFDDIIYGTQTESKKKNNKKK